MTAVAVDARNGQAATRAAESQLAVDIRVDQVPGVQDASSGAQTIRGDSSLDVKLHNLGPRPVRLTEVLYVLGQGGRTGRMLATDVSVRPGERMDRAFHVVLPCGSTRETAVPEGPAALMAKIRTTDGATHTVPVDLSALDELGGLFVSCNDYRQSALNADSQLVPGGVQVSLDLPTSDVSGAATVVVGLARSGLSARVGFATAPRLPATVPSGTHFTVTIRPVVHACPASLDLTALPAIALSFGDDTYPDPYLPLLVAQAVGRACANRGP